MQTKTGKQLGYIGDTAKRLFAITLCPECGEKRWVQIRNNKVTSTFCRKCCNKNVRNYRWKGGRFTGNDGYIYIQILPSMVNSIGYAPEHRIIMAKHLNRCLLSWEVIHHKNGKKDDNDLRNLELLPHGRFHLNDSVLKSRIAKLEDRLALLEAENTALHFQLIQLVRLCMTCSSDRCENKG